MSTFKTKPVILRILCAGLLCLTAISLPLQSCIAAGTDSEQIGNLGRNEKLVSQFVWQMMERDHLSNHAVDDEISQRAFDIYIKALDPSKVYFRKSDIREFSRWRNQLDDQLKAGDYTAAFQIFKRFVERVDQQTRLAIGLIDEVQDFSIDEEMVVDPDLSDYASSDGEARDIWRKRIKYNLLAIRGGIERSQAEERSAFKPKTDPKEMLKKRFDTFARRVRQMNKEDVVERYITSITSSFDPHTSYMSAGTLDNFMIQMNLELDGIGASLQGSEDGFTVIRGIVAGGAAAKQGDLKVDDKIVGVAQGDDQGRQADQKLMREYGSDFVDATGMSVDEVVDMVRGKAGTVVRLSVMSDSNSGLHTINLVRQKIQLEDRAAHGEVFEHGKKLDGSPNKIGVLELPMFYSGLGDGGNGRSTTTDVRKILEDFNARSVDALILDLRKNGGGSLKEAIDCTGLFIDAGPVVQVRDSYGQVDVLNDTDRGAVWKNPMVVLTSKFSASASEILAGAIQDYHRGLVVGDSTTHGKGTVQSMMNIGQMIYRGRNAPNEFGALKLTTQQFYRPNGDSTQLQGVLSDIVLPSITDKMDVNESDLDYAVKFDRIRRAKYGTYAMTSPRLIELLRERSASRQASSAEFQKQLSNISKYIENKNKKSISLNEEKFLARVRELKSKNDEEKESSEQMGSNNIKRDFYLDEVLQITSEYNQLLSEQSNSNLLTAADRF